MIDYKKLPVYEQKEKILDCLKTNQVIVVQSPTGSGKTTQIPVILHEAGYSQTGAIAVTQPRRIAALSVSEFIAKQLHTSYPGLVGYKMRFEDKTDTTTKIKIMTDGILLQEMKLDPWMTKYSVVMVDEAHERSLNIDFVLGLLKRVLAARPDFKVIVSSATMNAEAFSKYFNNCPIVSIDTVTFPVAMVYDPPIGKTTTATSAGSEYLLAKIEKVVERALDNDDKGDILIFLPGEKIIKDCIKRLSYASFRSKIHLVPLYGRLSKEEQEKVFDAFRTQKSCGLDKHRRDFCDNQRNHNRNRLRACKTQFLQSENIHIKPKRDACKQGKLQPETRKSRKNAAGNLLQAFQPKRF